MKVKMILPALTEAKSPLFRPIKYSLFPPLGLATLAAYLDADDEIDLQDEHVETLAPGRRARPRGDPGLHHLRLPRLRAGRPLPPRRAPTSCLGGLHVTSLPEEAAAPRRHDLPRPGRGHLARLPAPTSAPADPQPRLPLAGAHAGRHAAHPPRPHQAPPLPGAQLDRGLPRLPARLRLLLQGGLLRGRPRLLHPARGRGAGRDRRACPAATSTSWTTTSSATCASPPRSSTACAGWAGCGRRRARSAPCCSRGCWRRRWPCGLRSLFVGFETL